MTLIRCDLLFADKAVLIEGPTERMLLPKMIEKIDKKLSQDNQLSSQFISVVEVGGAYAHHFFKLLNFLELRTLIITDLDTVKTQEATRKDGVKTTVRVSCKVSEGQYTSNASIKAWFTNKNLSPNELIKKSDEEKTLGVSRITYQIPESSTNLCGRSFEDAFMLANPELFELNACDDKEGKAWDDAQKVEGEKTDFALQYAIYETEWEIPNYIERGLLWLASNIKKEPLA